MRSMALLPSRLQVRIVNSEVLGLSVVLSAETSGWHNGPYLLAIV